MAIWTRLLWLWAFIATSCFVVGQSPEQEPASFEDYFHDKALRLELYQCGDARELVTTLQNVSLEPCWPESRKNLLTPFPYGKFLVKVWDVASNRLIYSKGFDTLFAEYATTKPAILGTKRVFQTTTRIPFPKAAVKLTIERRNWDNSLSIILTEKPRAMNSATSSSVFTYTAFFAWCFSPPNFGSPRQ